MNGMTSRIARQILAMEDMAFVFVSIGFPAGMEPDKALEAARGLLPCETGSWELEQLEQDDDSRQWMVGNLEMPEWFYDQNPNGFKGAQDNTENGVTIEFDTP